MTRGDWLLTGGWDGTVRIWPMPEGQPLHTWSRDALLDKFRSLTNVRVVPDASAASEYAVRSGPTIEPHTSVLCSSN